MDEREREASICMAADDEQREQVDPIDETASLPLRISERLGGEIDVGVRTREPTLVCMRVRKVQNPHTDMRIAGSTR